MAVYNAAETLEETLDSVVAQEGVDLECIVVDDGSTDSTGQLLRAYGAKDGRFKILEQDNQGLTRSLMRGCAEARGTFIARQDAGDVSLPGRLLRQAEVLTRYPECSFVSAYTEFCSPHWDFLWLGHGAPDRSVPANIITDRPEQGLAGDIPHHGSVMFRRKSYEAVGGYRNQFYYGQDWDLWYRLARVGRFYVVPELLYRARIFPNGISMAGQQLQRQCAACSLGAFAARQRGLSEKNWLDRAEKYRPAKENADVLSKRWTNSQEPGLYFIGEALRRTNNSACRDYFGKAIRENPWKIRSYIRMLQSLISSVVR